MRLYGFFKKLWLRFLYRGVGIIKSNNIGIYDHIYLFNNPWGLDRKEEKFRFIQTNQIIKQVIGSVGNLLEVGCAEGHQTEHLRLICNKLYGFDISKTAINRAKIRCPDEKLIVSDFHSYKPQQEKFDLVVACEVLYYMDDVIGTIQRMSELGNKCLVTYLYVETHDMDQYFSYFIHKQYVKTKLICTDNYTWKVVWWNGSDICDDLLA